MSICPRIELSELPKDKSRAITPFQKELVNTFNYVRRNPEKLAVLKETMKHVYRAIAAYEQELKVTADDTPKVQVEETKEEVTPTGEAEQSQVEENK